MSPRHLAITPAVVCPASRYPLPHVWVPGDAADLLDYGNPDLGFTVRLGRCRYCSTALLALDPYTNDRDPAGPLYEVTGARL
jgi:hypothetical protein